MYAQVEKPRDTRNQDLEILEKAIYEAFDQDVRSDEVYSALNRLQKHSNRLGGFRAYREALEEPDPFQRPQKLKEAYLLIKQHLGR